MPDWWPASARGDNEGFSPLQSRSPNALKDRSRALARQSYISGNDGWSLPKPTLDRLARAAEPPYRALYFEGQPNSGFDPGAIDRLNKTSDDAALTLIGNPINRRLIREHEQLTGHAWPVDPKTGRKYDVAHIKALADGGANAVDNIRPMYPDDHMAEHIVNGDFRRWAKRPGIARAFGGTVVRGLGPLSTLLGLANGRIRRDTWNNTMSDLLGIPSQDDLGWQYGDQRQNPDYRPPGTTL